MQHLPGPEAELGVRLQPQALTAWRRPWLLATERGWSPETRGVAKGDRYAWDGEAWMGDGMAPSAIS